MLRCYCLPSDVPSCWAEMVQVFVAPIKENLKHKVELGQGGVASHQESSPDERTDISQDDTQLIDVGRQWVWLHDQSVRRQTLCFKGSPRILAVSLSCRKQ
jgi:hypothetical protein